MAETDVRGAGQPRASLHANPGEGKPLSASLCSAGRAGALWILAASSLLAAWPAAPAAWGARGSQERSVYIFHLKNGSQVQTSEYWEEGEDYRLERFGGVIGLYKGDVARIERIQPGGAPAPLPAPAAAAPLPKAAPGPSPGFRSQVSTYLAEMLEWVRAWLTRIVRRPAPGPVRQASGRRATAPAPPGDRPAVGPGVAGGGLPLLTVIAAALVVVPSFLFGGKRLGRRLFGATRA